MAAAQAAIDEARDVCDDKTATEVVYEVVLGNLQTVEKNLQYAVDHAWLPVFLTINIEAPVLYTINSKRGENQVLQYDPAEEHTFSIVDKVEGSAKQAFFFMEGDASTQVYVYPYAAGEKVLSADDTADGARKVFAKTKEVMPYDQWSFVKQENHYNIQPVGTSTYLSHYGGGYNKMGFYVYSAASDAGSLFTFTETTVSESGAYNSLKVYFDEVAKVASSEIIGGSNPGYYPEVQATAYNEAYAMAKVMLEGVAGYAECLSAYENLSVANEALVLNMPKEGELYVIRSVHTGYANGALVYVNPEDGKLYWSKEKTLSDPTVIWTIVPADDGTFYVYNLHTDLYMDGFTDRLPSPLNASAGRVSFIALSGDGQLNIQSNGRTMHAQDGGSQPIVNYAGAAGSASAWCIEEVGSATVVDRPMLSSDAVIYNLYGQRLHQIVTSGIYIVNGEKTYVKMK